MKLKFAFFFVSVFPFSTVEISKAAEIEQSNCVSRRAEPEHRSERRSDSSQAAIAQQAEYENQLKFSRQQLEEQEAMLKRANALMENQEQHIKRSLENQRKFSQLLSNWERQQAQYQKYLDSLSSSAR